MSAIEFLVRCLVVVGYTVFSVKPHYSPLVMPSRGEVAPTETARIFWAPHSWGLTKGHLVRVKDLFENYWNHTEEQGQYSSRQRG